MRYKRKTRIRVRTPIRKKFKLSEKDFCPRYPRIPRNSARLTKRQREVLAMMRDQDEELVYERGIGYVGLEVVGSSVVMGLLRLAALRADQFSKVGSGKLERYTINETGLLLLMESEKR